jgi:ABC-type transport system involved in multi-copper enzyme maturation permease subunit
MWNNIVAELLLLRRRASTWILLAIWTALSALFLYVLPYLTYRNGTGGPPGVPLSMLLPQRMVDNLSGSFPFYGGAIVLILGVLSLGSEYGWGTLKTLFTQGPGRLQIFAAKMVALAIALVPFVLTVFVVGVVGSATVANIEHAAVAWPASSLLLELFLLGWLILAVWTLFGVLLAVLSRGTALAIGVGLIWALVVEGLLSAFASELTFLQPIVKVLLRASAASALRPLSSSAVTVVSRGPGAFAGPYIGGQAALLVLGVYIVAFLLVSGAVLSRRDVA